MPRLTLHPACKIFPPLADDELQELADDIAENGLRNPIVLFQGRILDGRNRYKACKLAKVEPRSRSSTVTIPLAGSSARTSCAVI